MGQDISASPGTGPGGGRLKRALTLPLVVLYGLGVTIGAGIYVLIGETAGRAGFFAPSAFVLAAIVMALTAASFSELCGRMPVSAGEAAYVRFGFRSKSLSIIVGLAVATIGIVSAAAICLGCAGYIREFITVPDPILVPALVIIVTATAAWGITESVLAAGIFTLVEIAGLLIIVGFGIGTEPDLIMRLPNVLPFGHDLEVWIGVLSAGLLAFFAFIGFEDLVNVAEEVRKPERTLPKAIALTLIIATTLYFLVTAISVLTVDPSALSRSEAPLALVFQRVTGSSIKLMSAIAIIATLNGAIVQIIMASRVLYGLARQGDLPAVLGRVNSVTRTPVVATILVAAVILVLALSFPLGGLAETTSRITLSIFSLVNAALVIIKWRGDPAPPGTVIVTVWVPIAGFISCMALLAGGFFT